MIFLQTIIIAFSMFSAIPMPQFEWNKENMRYTMCAFPFIGIIIGLFEILWISIADFLDIKNMLFSAVFMLIPIAVTGGIHLDGFCDTSDALASNGDIEKKLKILSDSHCGAFAVISLFSYMIFYFGIVSEIDFNIINPLVLILIFTLSRTLSGLAIAVFKCAKNSGLAYTFADSAARKNVKIVLILYIVLILALMLFVSKIYIIIPVFALMMFLIYRHSAYKHFGGITGDLAGWFLQLSELLMLLALVIIQKLAVIL